MSRGRDVIINVDTRPGTANAEARAAMAQRYPGMLPSRLLP